jgi:hypothetical protein
LLISTTAKSQTVIKDVTIIDVQNNKVIIGRDVLIADNIIKAVSPSGKMKIPLHAKINACCCS